MKRMRITQVLLALAVLAGGCQTEEPPSATITLATTTSTRDSGLLDELLPMFRDQTGIEVKVVAVGTGQALEIGRRGDADVLMTHAPPAEQKMVDSGIVSRRIPFMYNDFVIVGPESDPAGIRGQQSAAAALTAIADKQATFVSRGDESGTHMKEKELWKNAGREHTGPRYFSAGSGMGATLRLASEKGAYALADRGTYLSQRDGLDLAILSEGDPLLRNQYAVLLLSAAKFPNLDHGAARRFAEFLTSADTQQTIGQFGNKQHGQPLFFSNALPEHGSGRVP